MIYFLNNNNKISKKSNYHIIILQTLTKILKFSKTPILYLTFKNICIYPYQLYIILYCMRYVLYYIIFG